ncbi:MAG: hypothetical protein OEX81_00085 [Candidatus Pacebacteria bacterium]|nr:hypothetical protein [Candidatus Paceibacterota bacterium]
MTQINNKHTFGQLFKLFRMKSGFRTLNALSNQFYKSGITISNSELSRWQNDKRTPKDRKTILVLIEILINHRGIRYIEEANSLLDIAGRGYLTESEISYLLLHTPLSIESEVSKNFDLQKLEEYQLKVRLNLPLSQRIDDYLESVSKKYNKTKAAIIRELIDRNMDLEENI